MLMLSPFWWARTIKIHMCIGTRVLTVLVRMIIPRPLGGWAATVRKMGNLLNSGMACSYDYVR